MLHCQLFCRSILMLTLLIFAVEAKAQVNTATFLGQVTDASGAVAPNAQVVIRNLSTNLERSTNADLNGNYYLSSLPAGSYRITVTAPGFKAGVMENIVAAAGDRLRLDFALKAGDIVESVTVRGETPLVNAASPELGVVIDSAKVAELPLNGRNFTQLVTLQPGVQSSSVNGRNSYNFNGGTQWGVNITLDGVDASFIESPSFGDPSGRSLLNTVSVDSIQEFRVLTGTFTAETGRASSGAVNVITKSGTNSYHGSLFEYFRNDRLDARNFFTYAPLKKDPRRQNQFGGTLGGPIIKNRLFFFGSYEGARLRVNQLVTATVPTAEFRAQSPAEYKPYFDLLPLPTSPIINSATGLPDRNAGTLRRSDQFRDDENLYNIRADYNTARSLSFIRYSLNRSENSIPNVIPANRQAFSIDNHLVSISHTHTLSSAMVNETRIGFNRWFVPRLNSTWNNANGLGEIGISGILTGGNAEGLLRFVDNSYTLADNLSYRHERHSLKTGFEVRRVLSDRIQRQNPVYSYNSAADFLANRPASVRIIFGQPGVGLRQTQTGIFLQDDFQVHSRLLLNLGLRYEYYSPVSGTNGRLFNVVSNPFGDFRPRGAQIYGKDFNNLNPRLGLAWDVRGNQKTVVRSGFGVYSSPLSPIFIWDTPTIDPRQPFAFNASPVDIPGLKFPISGSLRDAVLDPTRALALGLVPAVVGRRVIDPNLRDTYNLMWNATIQQQLANNWAIEIGYVGAHNLNAINTRSVNLTDPATRQRPVPSISEILIIEDSGRRKYNGLQVSLKGRQSHGLTTDIHYTYGHAIVYGGDDCCTGTNNRIQDFDNIAGSVGDANTDVRHALTFSYSYALPTGNLKTPLLKQVVGGWTVQGITRLRTGMPVTIFSGLDRRGNGVGGTQRVNYVGGSQYAADPTIANWFNRSAFAIPAAGTFGNLGYNTARGPGSAVLDLSLLKNFSLRNEHRLQFRAEFFNFPNHPTFGNPVNNFSSTAFGQIQTANTGRNVQLSLRYQF